MRSLTVCARSYYSGFLAAVAVGTIRRLIAAALGRLRTEDSPWHC